MNIPYDRFFWNYKWSDENARAKALNQIDWNFCFLTEIFMSKSLFLSEL